MPSQQSGSEPQDGVHWLETGDRPHVDTCWGQCTGQCLGVERLRAAVTYALTIIRDACEDLDDDGRQVTASALHTAHGRLASALTGEQR